jgi:hypothetical protein
MTREHPMTRLYYRRKTRAENRLTFKVIYYSIKERGPKYVV